MNDEVQNEIKKVQALAQSLQGQHDRNQNQVDRSLRNYNGSYDGGGANSDFDRNKGNGGKGGDFKHKGEWR